MQGLVCQHGEAECRLNRVFACAIDQAKHQEDWFPFIACVEGKYGPEIEDSVEGCAEEAGLAYNDIKDCATGAHIFYSIHRSGAILLFYSRIIPEL